MRQTVGRVLAILLFAVVAPPVIIGVGYFFAANQDAVRELAKLLIHIPTPH